MPTTQQLQAWLDECYAAKQALATGHHAQSVSSTSGRSITYTQANIGLLLQRIRELEAELGVKRRRGAATFQIGGH